MESDSTFSEIRLLNGSTGDPVLYIDYPGRNDAILFDAGENTALGLDRLTDLAAVFITHHHVDHFIGFDRIVRANIDRDKTLQVYGPKGTISKIYSRIKSYDYQFFPFQKIVLDIHELHQNRMDTARLECTRRFPRPKIQQADWTEPLVYENDVLKVEAVHVDHTVPCLAFAVVERPVLMLDEARLAVAAIARGSWIGEVIKQIRQGAPPETLIPVNGEPQPLGRLVRECFRPSRETRIAYVTDTAWSEPVRPDLLRLAGGAKRLYCDSFYAQEHLRQAETHHHMTAVQAAEFACAADVQELILIHFSTRYEGRYERVVEEARALFPRVSAEIPSASNKKSSSRANRS